MAAQVSTREMGESVIRMTKEGRKLTYQLTVIQQPERARACGSGAKSSADRRPVDPPPVVELRIFEGDAKNDITFSYNANFFLFATLESARPIIHGRVQPTAQQIPVLTGMPVSGMAYLDRPSEAGYFIFPDLSVRHEGKYKLSFNLYEETKDAKDSDVEQAGDSQTKPPPLAATPNGSFDWRLEVKSAPFTVYSAKKFPGLAESTILSRTVAEQGCRVRIRRDVRMRRRDGKTGGDYDEFDEDYSRARRTATPESVHESYTRPRSLSHTPVDAQAFGPETHRRQSGVDYPQQTYSSTYAPSPATPQSGSSGYLSFGGSSAQQYQAPQFTQPLPPQQSLQSQQPYQHPPPPPYRQPSTSNNSNYPERQQYSNEYASQRENFELGYRRASAVFPPPPPAAGNQYPAAADQNYNRNPYSQYPPRPHTPSMHSPLNLPPLIMPFEKKYDNLASPAGPPAEPNRLGPLPSPSHQERPSSYSQYPTSGPASAAQESSRSSKRPFDSVFSSSSLTKPLHNGMRPTSSHHTPSAATALDEDDDSVSMEALRMQYKRADGTSFIRALPALE